MKKLLYILFILPLCNLNAQTNLTVFPDSLQGQVNNNFIPGVFFVPKTAQAYNDFMVNGIQQNAIRTNIIEGALNNNSNLTSCLASLTSVQTDLIALSNKCSKLIFIFEKMPPWLSSSSDGSPASTGGWSVLNTKPPASWITWQTVVDSIVDKIVNQFGITNAYFEVWNEPDLGSWTGTMQEYFELYKRTFDGVKSANPTAKVGGPAVNFWSNNIYWQAPIGYISNAIADSSLIGQLLDSSVLWNKIPDFISWHNFNLSYQGFKQAENYINQKMNSLALPVIPLIISEWNAPNVVRDTRLATSFMVKAQMEIAKTSLSNNVVAAWQDFNFSTTEFHQDYGLLSYGAIHKPAYNSILLSEALSGTKCKNSSNVSSDVISTVVNDTLFILISNYAPPAILEAFNHTLYTGQYTANQLDSAGYIDIIGNNISHLDSIYKGLILLPGSNALQTAINNSIPVYQHYDSLVNFNRTFNISLSGYNGNYNGIYYLIDSTINNLQFRYDSLITAGYSQTAAINYILPNQNMDSTNSNFISGQKSLTVQPNSVCLFKIIIPGLIGVTELINPLSNILIYPNPTTGLITISNLDTPSLLCLFDINGRKLFSQNSFGEQIDLDLSNLPSGIYFLTTKNKKGTVTNKIIKSE